MRRALLIAIGLCLVGPGLTSEARAQPRNLLANQRSYDNGPRNVPEPRGSSMIRAQSLGLGTRQAASHLLKRAPRRRWVRAASGRVPRQLKWPLEGRRLGRGFGYVRPHLPELRHNGLDIPAPTGTEVTAVAGGIVAYSDNGVRGYGNLVMIVHPNGWMSMYAHLSQATVQPGWRVQVGERIGLVGNTGISRGPHLHFELHVDGDAIDPEPLFGSQTGRRHADVHHNQNDAPQTPIAPTPGEPRFTMQGLGTASLARRVLTRGLPPQQATQVPGRRFRNLLWPLRGGSLGESSRRGAELLSEGDTPVRAAADGVVIYVGGRLRGEGDHIVMVHPGGFVTRYSGVQTRVQAGAIVRRGEWIGRTRADQPARFVFVLNGRKENPALSLVQIPEDES